MEDKLDSIFSLQKGLTGMMNLDRYPKDMEEKVYKTVKELHNYDVPEITTIETSNVDPDYLNWVNQSLNEK